MLNFAFVETEEVGCLFCHTGDHPVLVEEGGWRARRCPTCGLVYVSPRPTLENVVGLYAEHDSGSPSFESATYRRRHARRTLRLIRKHGGGRRVLEIGSGFGYFLQEAQAQGFEPMGIELDPSRATHIRELGLHIEQRPLSPELVEGQEWDVVYHCDVVSHLYDPIGDLKLMRESLDQGGLLVMETGNLGDVEPRYYRHYPSFQLPDHLYSFSESNIRTLLQMTEFELVRIYRHGQLPLLRLLSLLTPRTSQAEESPLNAPPLAARLRRIVNSRMRKSSFLKRVGYFGMYCVRYPLGQVMPKRAKPQTLIVIARAA